MTNPGPESGSAIELNPLLERERELSAFDGLLRMGDGERPALALIEGPAGIGKSA